MTEKNHLRWYHSFRMSTFCCSDPERAKPRSCELSPLCFSSDIPILLLLPFSRFYHLTGPGKVIPHDISTLLTGGHCSFDGIHKFLPLLVSQKGYKVTC